MRKRTRLTNTVTNVFLRHTRNRKLSIGIVMGLRMTQEHRYSQSANIDWCYYLVEKLNFDWSRAI